MNTNVNIDLYSDWIQIIKSELMFLGYSIDQDEKSENICFMYFNLKKRLIEPKPRNILLSNVFNCPDEYKDALDAIIIKIKQGRNLKPHLSTKLYKLDYNDDMLNDWGIYHLHLGTKLDNKGFVNRTGPLLYAFFDDNNAYFINVLYHGAWTKQDIIKIVHNNWPESIEQYKLNGVIELETQITDDDLKKLRRAHINTCVEIDKGIVYAPMGGGYSTSGLSVDVVRHCDHYTRIFKNLEKDIKNNLNSYISKIEKLGKKCPTTLSFKLELDFKDVYIFEANTKILFKLCSF